ncbi:hypothetical protein IMSAGC014_00963 [Bacteroidaceae bacterium]|nr:hypothetical protein IMSAGC014_00963 [Bacteroidaceae bacterium]
MAIDLMIKNSNLHSFFTSNIAYNIHWSYHFHYNDKSSLTLPPHKKTQYPNPCYFFFILSHLSIYCYIFAT